MEHPLIFDADSLTIEELGKKITNLTNKYVIASKSGNGYLCGQLSMAIETYKQAHSRKLEETFKKDSNGEDWLNDKINIS